VRAPRDNAWVADGIVSETWLPVSPVSGRLDAFAWTLPPPVLGSAAPAFEEFGQPSAQPMAGLAAEPPPVLAAGSGRDRAADDADLRTVAAEGEVALAVPQEAAEAAQSPAASVTAPDPAVLPDPADAKASAPVATHGPVMLADGLPRVPDDPGPEPGAVPPARRSFWGFGSR
jgi:HemY protein